MITVTKSFSFAMAHNLMNHNGKCRYIHGHNYKLEVTVSTNSPSENVDGSIYGMLIDFKDLNKIISDNVIEKYDHSFLVWNRGTGFEQFDNFLREILDEEIFRNNIRVVSYRPTAENMCVVMAKEIQTALDSYNKKNNADVFLVKLRLYETDDSYAEYADIAK